jgi:hypothetical protein
MASYYLITISRDNLFHLAARYLGDATRWDEIAALNGLTDPMITAVMTIKIPGAAPPSLDMLTWMNTA